MTKLMLKTETYKYLSQKMRVALALLTFMAFMCQAAVAASPEDVVGTVVNSDGEPLVGVAVLINGTRASALTDVNGQFHLVSKKKKFPMFLTFKYIGCKDKEVRVQNESYCNMGKIVMEDDGFSINEVVVVGYGQSSKEKLLGSVADVKGSAVTVATQDSPILAMQGNAAGVYVVQGSGVPGGGSSSVLVRGQKSLSSSSSYTKPLYIIDGVPFNTNRESPIGYTSTGVFNLPDALSFLNPDDIESISVLKDADATAIYGTRGSNGVVLITTKKGQKGSVKVNVQLSKTASWIPKRLDFLNTEEYVALRRKALDADVAAGVFPNGYDEDDYPELFLFDQTKDYDWQEQLLGNTAWGTDAQVRVSGGGSNTTFSVSGAYYNSETVSIGNDDYSRYTASANIQHHTPDNRFRLEAGMNLSRIHMDADIASNCYSIVNTAPNTPLFDEEGRPYYIENNRDWNAPLCYMAYEGENKVTNVIFNTTASYRIWQGLTAKVALGYEYSSSNQTNLYDRYYYNPYNPRYYNMGRYYTLNTSVLNIEPQITYSTPLFGGDASVLLGMTYQKSEDKTLLLYGQDYPGDIFLNNASSAATLSTHSNPTHQSKLASFFMRLGYDWKDKYLFNFVLRRDGSSRFGPNNRFGTFFSLGAGWVFSHEKFFKESSVGKWWSFGKFRMSYGKTGNDNLADYEYITKYTTSRYPYEDEVGITPTNISNEDLHWETTYKFDMGLELGFLKNRLMLNMSYYDYRTKECLWNQKLASQAGFSNFYSNLNAEVQNKGFELEINSRNIEKKNFSWTTSFNITFPVNKLLSYENLESSSYANTYRIGESLHLVRGYKYLGVDPETGCAVVEDVNQDGNIDSTNDYQVLGDTDPVFYGGITNTFKYKNFSLEFLLYFRKKTMQTGYFWRFFDSVGGLSNVTHDLANNYWTGPGDTSAKYPGLTTMRDSPIGYSYYYYLSYSDIAYSDASYIKLQNLKLAYNMPVSITKLLGMSALQFYVQGRNLFTITNYDSYDPETGDASMPQLRQITFGFNATF